jgi:hypothetical protein
LLGVRDNGVISGPVSGGCVEDDLIARTKAALKQPDAERAILPTMIVYGGSKEEAARFGLPCGGTLRLAEHFGWSIWHGSRPPPRWSSLFLMRSAAIPCALLQSVERR